MKKVILTGYLSSNWGYPLLFDPKPKEDPKDLFDREKEMEKLKFGINYPMTLLLGIRRSGKIFYSKSINECKNIPIIIRTRPPKPSSRPTKFFIIIYPPSPINTTAIAAIAAFPYGEDVIESTKFETLSLIVHQ